MHSLRVDQIPADSHRDSSRPDKIGEALLSYTSGSDQGYMRKRGFEGPDIADAAQHGTGKNLDEIRTRLPSSHDFAGRHCARKDHHVLLDRELHNLKIQSRARQKPSAGV